jgi:hypothetical protein
MRLLDFFRKRFSLVEELTLLRTVLGRLPVDVARPLSLQVEEGLIRGSIPNASDVPGYSAFTFNGEVARKFENHRSVDYMITDIYLRNEKRDNKIRYTTFFFAGLISGYSIQPSDVRITVDLQWADTTQYKINVECTNNAWETVTQVLGKEKMRYFSPSTVYPILIDGSEYYHLRDLDDGDFLGMGPDGALYVVSHEGMILPSSNEFMSDRNT